MHLLPHCTACGKRRAPHGYCVCCGQNAGVTMRLTGSSDTITETTTTTRKRVVQAPQIVRVHEVEEEDLERFETGIAGVDRVLGGGLVAGSKILLAGDPGTGKSTLLMQILAATQYESLYVSGEERVEQVAHRAKRFGKSTGDVAIVHSTDIDETLAAFDELEPAFGVIDSLQKMKSRDVASRAGSPGQLVECLNRIVDYGNDTGVAFFIVCHVTKDGEAAGPETVKHLADGMLYMSGHKKEIRELGFPEKYRFGDACDSAYFRMTKKGMVEVPGPRREEDE